MNIAEEVLSSTYIRKIDLKIVILLTFIGMTHVLCLINGVASANRTVLHGGMEGVAFDL